MNLMTTIVPSSGARPYRMSADGYLKAIGAGAFADARVELFDGELVETSDRDPDGMIGTSPGMEPIKVTADDYIRMIDAGAFGNAHVELIDGSLIEMAPAQTEHSRMHGKIVRLLGGVYPAERYDIFVDVVTLFDDKNVRAPDIAIVEGSVDGRKQLAPADILLAVEVSSTTLREDIGRKRVDYALAGIRHYWVVDIDGRRTHCYAEPLGADFATITVAPFGEPIAVPGAGGTIVIA